MTRANAPAEIPTSLSNEPDCAQPFTLGFLSYQQNFRIIVLSYVNSH